MILRLCVVSAVCVVLLTGCNVIGIPPNRRRRQPVDRRAAESAADQAVVHLTDDHRCPLISKPTPQAK